MGISVGRFFLKFKNFFLRVEKKSGQNSKIHCDLIIERRNFRFSANVLYMGNSIKKNNILENFLVCPFYFLCSREISKGKSLSLPAQLKKKKKIEKKKYTYIAVNFFCTSRNPKEKSRELFLYLTAPNSFKIWSLFSKVLFTKIKVTFSTPSFV